MADHVEPLTWSDADFGTVLTKLDQAFSVGAASYYYSTEAGAHALDVFDHKRAGFTVREWRKWRAGVNGMDQLLVFAFEDAPDDVVRSWAEWHDENLGGVAVDRVARMRQDLPAAAAEWNKRFNGFGSMLGDLDINVVYNPSVSDAQAHLRIDAFIAGGGVHVPVMSSRQFLQAVITRNEVRRLISLLEEALEVMPDFELAEEDGVEGD